MFAQTEDTSIMIEPRLLEFITKQKYYEENNIMPTIPLEKEYRITDQDIIKIRGFYRGDKNKGQDRFQDFVDPAYSTFPSSDLKKDKRLRKIKKKQQMDREASEQRNNYGIMQSKYDMYSNDRRFASAMGDNFARSLHYDDTDEDDIIYGDDDEINTVENNVRRGFSTQNCDSDVRRPRVTRDAINRSNDAYENSDNRAYIGKRTTELRALENSRDVARSENWNKNRLNNNGKKQSFSNEMSYSDPVKIQNYNSRVHFGDVQMVKDHERDINNLIGKANTYRERDERINNDFNDFNDMDIDNKVVIPKNNSNGKRGAQNQYMPIPFMRGTISHDADVDNYVSLGSGGGPQKKRSIGYPGTFEHGFQYISSDLQEPDHVVMQRGFPSRSFNKSETTSASRYERQIMP